MSLRDPTSNQRSIADRLRDEATWWDEDNSEHDTVAVATMREGADEVERLRAALDTCEERSKACDQIADGDYGWEKLATLCIATMSVCRLRSNYEQTRAALERAYKAMQTRLTAGAWSC